MIMKKKNIELSTGERLKKTRNNCVVFLLLSIEAIKRFYLSV